MASRLAISSVNVLKPILSGRDGHVCSATIERPITPPLELSANTMLEMGRIRSLCVCLPIDASLGNELPVARRHVHGYPHVSTHENLSLVSPGQLETVEKKAELEREPFESLPVCETDRRLPECPLSRKRRDRTNDQPASAGLPPPPPCSASMEIKTDRETAQSVRQGDCRLLGRHLTIHR